MFQKSLVSFFPNSGIRFVQLPLTSLPRSEVFLIEILGNSAHGRLSYFTPIVWCCVVGYISK